VEADVLEVLLGHLEDIARVGEEDVAIFIIPTYGGFKFESSKGLWSCDDTFEAGLIF